jgi:uncharacterized protein YdeI (YjbR/CyaY-like superfamily)
MNEKAATHEFTNREEYRNWLIKNHKQEDGIWITFVKGNKSFSAKDALEESICFGWIDGLIKSIDAKTYKKYFSRRKDRRKWSDKNIAIYKKLVRNRLMTNAGTEVYEVEKKSERNVIDINEKIGILRAILKEDEEILNLFENKPPSRQKQFAGFYCDAKTDTTRNKRKEKIVQALRNNYDGMLY